MQGQDRRERLLAPLQAPRSSPAFRSFTGDLADSSDRTTFKAPWKSHSLPQPNRWTTPRRAHSSACPSLPMCSSRTPSLCCPVN